MPLSLHPERLSAAPDQFQGMDLSPLRQGTRRKISDPLQRENLERSGRRTGSGVGGRPRPQAAPRRRDQGRGGRRNRRLHAPALFPLPGAGRHRIAPARHGCRASTTSFRIYRGTHLERRKPLVRQRRTHHAPLRCTGLPLFPFRNSRPRSKALRPRFWPR